MGRDYFQEITHLKNERDRYRGLWLVEKGKAGFLLKKVEAIGVLVDLVGVDGVRLLDKVNDGAVVE